MRRVLTNIGMSWRGSIMVLDAFHWMCLLSHTKNWQKYNDFRITCGTSNVQAIGTYGCTV